MATAARNIYFFGGDEMWSAHLSSLHAQLTCRDALSRELCSYTVSSPLPEL